MAYTKGELIRCRAVFRDPEDNEALVDPSVVRFKFMTPAGVETTYTYNVNAQIIRESKGRYYVDLDTSSAAGQWHWRWPATGTFQTAAEGSFTVRESVFA